MVARWYKFHDMALYNERQKDIAEYKQSFKDKIKTIQEQIKWIKEELQQKKDRLKELRKEYKNKFTS